MSEELLASEVVRISAFTKASSRQRAIKWHEERDAVFAIKLREALNKVNYPVS